MTYVELQEVRDMIGEPTSEDVPASDTLFTDEQIQGWINSSSNLNGAILKGWQAKMAHFAGLVNVTDGAASREMSDLFLNASAMVKTYTRLAEGPAAGRSRIGRIVRS